MTTRSKAFFNGQEVQCEWEMTRSHGTSPDVGRITFRQGTPLPPVFRGDLVLTNGSVEVVRFRDCILMRPQEKFSRTRDIVYQVLDWRWKWKTPVVFGQYNVRDDNNELVVVDPDIRKNPRELALILFRALHKKELEDELMTDEDFDVTALPEDADLAPHVNWMYTPAAVELDKLCAFFACSVAPQNDGTFKIVEINQGDEPDNTNLKQPVETGLIINPAPDFVTAYAGDTWFDGWLCLEPIGMEVSGAIKPIEMLSYAPINGWSSVDPKTGIANAVRAKLIGLMSAEEIDKRAEIASRTVFRMFRICALPQGQVFFPGFTLEDPVEKDELPEVGDPSKVYVVNGEDVGLDRYEQRMAIWDGTRYVGLSIVMRRKSSDEKIGSYLYDPEKISDINETAITGSFEKYVPYDSTNPQWRDYFTEVFTTNGGLNADRTTSGNPRLAIAFNTSVGIDTRTILPLLGTRVTTEKDDHGKKARMKAEIFGIFFEDDYRGRNMDQNNGFQIWKKGFSIDNATGHVTLSGPAYMRGEFKHPHLFLRVGYGLRLSQYGPRYHRQFNKPTGSTLGIANAVVPRTDLNEYRIMKYTNEYNDPIDTEDPVTTTEALDTMLEATATEYAKQYQNTAAPKRKVYTPLRAVDLNGKVMQVSYSGGLRPAETVVSIGASYDITQSPAKKKAMMDAQKKQMEAAMLRFTPEQMPMIIDQSPNIGNTFDAANIA